MSTGVGIHLKRLIGPVYLPMFLLSLGNVLTIAAFPQYLGSLGATVATTGLIVSLTGVGHLVSDIPGGMILGRSPLQKVMIACLIIAAAASVGIAIVTGLAGIALLWLLTGIVTTVVVTGIMTYVRVTVPAVHRGRALATVGGSFRMGGFLGPAIGGLIVDRLGMPVAFWARALCYVAAAVALLLSHDRSPRMAREARPGIGEQVSLVRDGMKGRWTTVLSVGSAIMILSLLRATRAIALPLWGDSLSLNATTIGAVISIGAVMDLLLFVPSGLIMDKSGRKTAASICIGIFSIGLFILPATRAISGFVIASLLIGLGNGFGAGINMTLGTDLAPANAPGAFIGFWRLFGDIGQTAGPVVVGAMASAAGLSASLYLAAGIGAVGLGIMLFVAPETLHLARKSG